MKLFGAAQREVVGDSVSRLFPEPLCNYAQVRMPGLCLRLRALLSYLCCPVLSRTILCSGLERPVPIARIDSLYLCTQEVLDACSAASSDHGGSTMVIGKHRQGHAIALSVSGQEMGGGETAYTVRSAAVHEEFLLFMSDSLKVTAASQETMTMLGVRTATNLFVQSVNWLHGFAR